MERPGTGQDEDGYLLIFFFLCFFHPGTFFPLSFFFSADDEIEHRAVGSEIRRVGGPRRSLFREPSDYERLRHPGHSCDPHERRRG